jgi:hypothetical protein
MSEPNLPYKHTIFYLAAIAGILALLVAIAGLILQINATQPTPISTNPASRPTDRNVITGALSIGSETVIQNASIGGRLYLYYEPRLSSITIPIPLFDGEVVRIVDGPVTSDNYRWWKIVTIDFSEGWIREAYLQP